MTKVLLVEDDKSLREIYAVRLVEEGYDIVSAGDGEEALAMAIKDRPSLIISDVMMPKISGFDMLDILRSTTETKDIKVIMMTALSSEDQRERGVTLGADRYLVKSQVGIEDVVRTVHEVLGDAPIAGQQPLMAAAPRPVPSTPQAPTNTIGGTIPQPIVPAGSVPITPITPSTPVPATPTVPQAPAAPQAPPASGNGLPQPMAPFSTPRTATPANRVIQPITPASNPTTDLGKLMAQELSGTPVAPAPPAQTPATPATPPVTPQLPNASPQPTAPPAMAPTPTPMPQPTPPATPSSGLNFEETPRIPSAPAPTPVTIAPQPSMPVQGAQPPRPTDGPSGT